MGLVLVPAEYLEALEREHALARVLVDDDVSADELADAMSDLVGVVAEVERVKG